MSTKSQRSVAFQTPADTSSSSTPGPTEDKTYSVPMAVLANMKEASRSRCRARSRSWSRFRSRRSKSQDARSSDPGLGQSPKRDLSVVGLVRTASRNSVRSLVKLFESRWMNEGRKTQIVLLDERRLDIIIQPKLYSNDLLDLVASHFKLKEKHYFGLGFFDDTNNFNWLQGDRRVLDHEFPKKTGLLILHFSIRSYVETIGLLRDSQTVELFYLNARLGVFRGQIECEAEIIFELAAHVLQATCGDFVSNEEAKEDLKKLPVIPTCTLKKHPSIAYCEERVIFYYEKLSGTSRGLAIVNYMNIIEKLPTYGIHYYNVKDKKDIPWWLGISPKGIAVYDINDKTTPRKLFTWKNLENLYYRDKKFSIEVHGPKREANDSHIIHTLSSFNPYEDAVREPAESKDDLSTAITDPTTQVSVSRRTFGASNVDVHAWFTTTAQLTKCIWNMAVAQHQFYLDRKQSKGQIPVVRTMSDIAADLCSSSTSLPGSTGSDLSRSPSSHSLPSLSNSRYDLSIEQSDSIKAERDMYQALKARKEALEDALKKKMEELKLLCIQEGELTGELPKETPLSYGEAVPVFRRRIGTSFSLSAKNVDDVNNLSNELSKLELEVELQGKITSAAQRLASDKTVSKYVHKQRKQSYSKALVKLKEMEKKLSEMHKQVGKSSGSSHHHHNRGRPSDGMYYVNDAQTYSDFDPDRISSGASDMPRSRGYFFLARQRFRNSSVASSLSSLGSRPSRHFSSGSLSLGSDVNSLCSESQSVSSEDTASCISFSTEDTVSCVASSEESPHIDTSVSITDEYSILRGRPRKHYVITRSSEQRGFSEDMDVSQQSSFKSNGLNLAIIDDLDDFGSEASRGSMADQTREPCSTKVLPRQQSLIISKSLRKTVLVRQSKVDIIENACKLFEKHEGTPANKLTSKDMSHQEVQDETANKTIISPSHSSPQLYSNQGTSQRQQHFIGLSGRGTKSVQSSDPSMSSHLTPHSRQDTSYESGFSSANNMYNVSSQRTSHYESADQLKSPATSEPGHIYSSLSSNDSALGLSKHGSGDEPFLRAAPNSSGSYLHYGSLDRKRQNYRQDALRDLSPVGYRSHNKGYAGQRMNSPETGGYKDPQSPSHIVDDHAPTVRHAWDQNASYKEDAHLKPGLNNYNPIHVYSPRMYEGALGRPYHDVDVTHVHSKEAHEHGLVGAHHTMSQPVFHRTERSLSPAKHQEVLYHRPHPPSGFESQHGVGSFQTVPEGYVPIQHVDKHFSSHHSDTHLSGHSHGTDTHIPIQFSSGHIRGTETHIPIQHSPGHLHGNETHIPIQHSTGNMYGTQAHIQQHPSGLVHGKETNIPIQHSPSPIPIPQNETRIPGHLPLQHSEGHSSGSQYSHVGSPSSPRSPASYASSTLVTVTQLQPHRELTKPYEISDFYRYSEKLRRQRIIDQYQRQLMGVDRMSRSSSPLSVDSDGHSSHSGSSSSNPVSHSPSHHQSVPFSGRGPLHTYIRSASAPLHSTLQPPLQTLPPPHPNHPEGQITSSASSYSVKSHGANMNYAMQSSVKVHQVHTAAKHSVYQPPQPMTCNPVRNPPYKKT
ncbi:FERM domain-containing protein 4B [Biomphalaria glabrata]|nr:FERM domain-containing protein 4B [Biomphalaria glabrata]